MSTSSKKTSKSNNVSPSQALRVLAASLCSSEAISYGNEDQSFKHNIKKDQNKILDIDVDSMSRDIFYSSNLLGVIEDGIGALELEDYEDLANVDWDEYFDFENASIVFESATPDDSGMDHMLWVANVEKRWLITCRGYMGEYCDEDFDVTAFFSIYTDISKKEFEKLLTKQVDELVASEVSAFCTEMSATQKSLPQPYQHLIEEGIMKYFKQHDITRPYVALHEKEVIQQSLGLNIKGSDIEKAQTSKQPNFSDASQKRSKPRVL